MAGRILIISGERILTGKEHKAGFQVLGMFYILTWVIKFTKLYTCDWGTLLNLCYASVFLNLAKIKIDILENSKSSSQELVP